MLTDILIAPLLLALGSFAAACIVFAIKLIRADSLEYARNQRRTKSLMHAVRGEVNTVHSGSRDYRVSAGIAIDRKTNRWVEQGRLSDEAITASLRPRVS